MADDDEMDAELSGLTAEVGRPYMPAHARQPQPSRASGLRMVAKGIRVIVWVVIIIAGAIATIGWLMNNPAPLP